MALAAAPPLESPGEHLAGGQSAGGHLGGQPPGGQPLGGQSPQRPGQPLERWTPRGSDPASRMRSWSDILAATHLGFEVRPTYRTPNRFQAAVTRRPIGDLMLVDCAAAPFLGHRDSQVIASRAAKRAEIDRKSTRLNSSHTPMKRG